MPALFDADGEPFELIGGDTETHLITPGRLIPRMVCLTLTGVGTPPEPVCDVAERWRSDAELTEEGGRWAFLCGRKPGIEIFPDLLKDPRRVIAFHNAPFDLAVLAEATHRAIGVQSLLCTHRGHTVWDALDDPRVLRARHRGHYEKPPEGFEWVKRRSSNVQESARILDTRTREQLLAIAFDRMDFDPRTGQRNPGFNLASLVDVYFGVDITGTKSKRNCKCTKPDVERDPSTPSGYPIRACEACGAWRLVYHRLDGTPVSEWPEDAKSYAIEDSEWAERVALAQAEPQKSDNGKDVARVDGSIVDEDAKLRTAFALHLDAAHGVRSDSERVALWRIELEEAVDLGNVAARSAGFLRENGSKEMAKLYALIEEAYGAECPRTPKGKAKTDAETLLGSGNDDLIAFAKSSAHRKNLTTYLPILGKGVHHPITSSPNALVKSGRTSWRRPNLQNPPRKGGFRECLIPRPGNVFVSVDYDRIEMCALAQIHLWWFGASDMAEALIAGEDLHLSVGAELLGIAYWEAERRIKEGDPAVEDARQLAKVANFGFPGGLSSETFVDYAKGQGHDLTPERSEEIREAWLDRWSQMRQYFEQVKQACAFGRFTATQLRTGRQRGGCSFTSGCNTFFQGLVADGATAAAYEVSRECYSDMDSVLYGVRPWVFLHDEIIAEGPERTATQWAARISEIMVKVMRLYIPDVPINAEPAAMRRWYKGAKTVRGERGELLPWEPTP